MEQDTEGLHERSHTSRFEWLRSRGCGKLQQQDKKKWQVAHQVRYVFNDAAEEAGAGAREAHQGARGCGSGRLALGRHAEERADQVAATRAAAVPLGHSDPHCGRQRLVLTRHQRGRVGLQDRLGVVQILSPTHALHQQPKSDHAASPDRNTPLCFEVAGWSDYERH